jgi:hypothetical protein
MIHLGSNFGEARRIGREAIRTTVACLTTCSRAPRLLLIQFSWSSVESCGRDSCTSREVVIPGCDLMPAILVSPDLSNNLAFADQ